MAPYPKRAILFSTLPSPIIARVITRLNDRGYAVPLLICSLGPNNFLPLEAHAGLGARVGSIFDEIDDPPAVLCVTNTKSLEQIYISLDPDLALVWGYAFPITAKMLNWRAPFVNFHPAPLPLMRGPSPWAHFVLDKSIA